MASRRRTIDPETGDYVVEGGRIVDDSSHTSQVLLAVRMKRGTCAVDRRFGSELFKIKKLDTRAPRRAQQSVTAALGHLTSRKVIQKLRVTPTVEGDALAVPIDFEDQDGTPRRAPYTHQVG